MYCDKGRHVSAPLWTGVWGASPWLQIKSCKCTTAMLSVVLTNLGRPLPGCLSVVPMSIKFCISQSRVVLYHPFCWNFFIRSLELHNFTSRNVFNNFVFHYNSELWGRWKCGTGKCRTRKYGTNDVNFEGPKCSTGKCVSENAGLENAGPGKYRTWNTVL